MHILFKIVSYRAILFWFPVLVLFQVQPYPHWLEESLEHEWWDQRHYIESVTALLAGKEPVLVTQGWQGPAYIAGAKILAQVFHLTPVYGLVWLNRLALALIAVMLVKLLFVLPRQNGFANSGDPSPAIT